MQAQAKMKQLVFWRFAISLQDKKKITQLLKMYK